VGSGDLDGDGVADLLIGVPRAPGMSGESEAGQVRVLFGPGPAGPAVVDLAATSDVRIYGASTGARLGGIVPSPFQQRGVAGFDWDGDGFDEIAMTSAGDDPPGRTDFGKVHVLYGQPRATWPAVVDLDVVSAPVELWGTSAGSWPGLCLVADDFDQDGKQDLVVTSPRAGGPGGRTMCGQLFVLFGRLRVDIPATFDLATDFDLRFIGQDSSDLAGIYAFPGDLDGDATPDLLFSACAAMGPGNSIPVAGECYVYYMPSVTAVVPPDGPGYRLRRTGRHPADRLGLVIEMPRRAGVVVEVHDLSGRRVATLVDGELEAGSHPLSWSPAGGRGSAAGIYFVTARGPLGRTAMRAVVLR
jgi:hypothetical protein